MQDDKPTLDYSSPAIEHAQAKTAEQKRREAVEAYNQLTFGQRRPFASVAVSLAIFAAIACLVGWLLPREIARPIMWLSLVVIAIWRLRSGSSSPSWGSSIGNPFRWW